ncbi:MAG TPA: 16S rRNA (adenine(1518)-N(6)/adenine(1519)-N(6))-dimethyltransferase RsmA [Acidobacteriaceae bacterium]
MQKKARLGQNFLVDAEAQRAIVEALGDVRQATVAEIGPGAAAITDLLAGRARRVIAIELDRALAAALRTRFLLSNAEAGYERVQVLEQDVLAVDLTALAASLPVSDEGPGAGLAVVGNLPYYITSDILLHLFRHQAVLGRTVLMVQREVADRMVAEPGGREYGMLSASCQLYARVERLFTLPPRAFSPPPQVHSSVVRLTFAPRFAELGVEPAAFLAHLRVCFAQKRKTLANNLRAAGVAGAVVAEALAEAGIEAQARAETLTLEEQARLFRALRLVPSRAQ